MAKKSSAKKASPKTQEMEVTFSNPDKVIPKLCNRINLAKDNQGNIIMSMFFLDPISNQMMLIDRVILDKGHSKEFSKVLINVIEK